MNTLNMSDPLVVVFIAADGVPHDYTLVSLSVVTASHADEFTEHTSGTSR